MEALSLNPECFLLIQGRRTSFFVSEPASISESKPSAECPACKKTLLTRSARLCLFCGGKLPDDLLFPLSEVHREEQQSLDTVKRVIGAYEEREVEMVERSRHITHAGVLFDDQIREILFPAEAGADQWALHAFSRTLKLPEDDFDARRHKKELDEAVRKLASKLATSSGRLECKISADQAGHLSARLTDKALSVVIETQFGRNATFIGGTSHAFRSYSIRAEGRVLALNKADGSARRFRTVCVVAGILGVPAGFVWLAYTVSAMLGLEMFHRLWLHEPGVTLALLFAPKQKERYRGWSRFGRL